MMKIKRRCKLILIILFAVILIISLYFILNKKKEVISLSIGDYISMNKMNYFYNKTYDNLYSKDVICKEIKAPLPDEFGHELGTDAVTKTDAGVLLLTKTATADQIADKLQEFGVLVLGKPFTGAQFRQAVQLAASNYKRLAVLRAENAKLLDKIAQLRLVDRAKCYLIEKKHYTETEAHRLIEKMAMDTRRPRGEIAQEILEEDDEE